MRHSAGWYDVPKSAAWRSQTAFFNSAAPKSTTSTPWERSFSASEDTFMVDDTLMEEMRSAMGLIAACIRWSSLLMRFGCCQPGAEPCFHRRRHQAGNIPAQEEDFFHQAG